MFFYKILEEADQTPRRDGLIIVAGELYTPAEAERYRINPSYYEEVEIPENDTYYMFGARFA